MSYVCHGGGAGAGMCATDVELGALCVPWSAPRVLCNLKKKSRSPTLTIGNFDCSVGNRPKVAANCGGGR